MPDPRDTPAMRQFYRFKKQHPGCLLFFRIGDFYETFDDDAVLASKHLGLTLTRRTEGLPMAGAPYHQLENYLRKALEQGLRVAVCDQIQDASEVKSGSIIDRAVTRVLTPGTLVDDALLESSAQRPLGAVFFTESGDDSPASLAVVDLSTGRFDVSDCPSNALIDELARAGVSELIYLQSADDTPPPRVQRLLTALSISGTPQPAWHFRPEEARESLLKLYGVSTLLGFGLADDDAVVRAAGAIIRYLHSTQTPDAAVAASARRTLAHLSPPRRISASDSCILDATTLRALEVLETIRPAAAQSTTDGSLLGVFAPTPFHKGCRTPMGKRLLREWLCRPLFNRAHIEARQHAVSTLFTDRTTAEALAAHLEAVQDIPRICARIALDRATPRDLVALAASLAQATPIAQTIQNAPALAALHSIITALQNNVRPLADRIRALCVDSPPPHLREGGLIRDGVDPELDQARLLQRDAGAWMVEYQARLVAAHDLPNLKVGYNKIFGYYIELPAAQSKRAPDIFTRKQTLKNAERYITPELKEFENKVSTAEARALARETALFDELCAAARDLIPSSTSLSTACAELDVLSCFAEKAHRRSWKRPEIIDHPALALSQARHPVLDELLGSSFVPNDLSLARADQSPSPPHPPLALITGPNMAGKSTYIRTAALITLLAHTGSFVPADSATIGLTDRIFTRIGADDALHAGQSTFMVEMTETARILNHATPRSLIILDEIGRGTSTLDGLSLAWAIAETLASASPRTLFATHYHELTDLAESFPDRVQNLHVAVREWGDEIVFLHRILPGKTDQSYGIHVAKLAGIPATTIARAREVLARLSVQHHTTAAAHAPGASSSSTSGKSTTRTSRPHDPSPQLSLFTEYVAHPAVDQLKELKLDHLTPLQAFDRLRELKDLVQPKT